MASMEEMMDMLSTLILFLLIALLLMKVFGGGAANEISFGQSYVVTNKVVSMINIISASPQNETAVLKIEPFTFKIFFDMDENYVESEVDFLGGSEYGLYVFEDIDLIALDGEMLDCYTTPCTETIEIFFDKRVTDAGTKIYVSWNP